MQSKQDKERILNLGATTAFDMGNLKYDQLELNLKNPKRTEISNTFSSLVGPIVVFGSTHREETKKSLELVAKWKAANKSICTIIAPRHFHHLQEYLDYSRSLGLTPLCKTEFEKGLEFDCLFLDTYGELAFTYEIANLCIIGGSFEPIGGHSILEPAIFGKPILYGPHMENNREICSNFEAREASICTADFVDLEEKIDTLLNNPDLTLSMGQKAHEIAHSMCGATGKIINWLDEKESTDLS
jgi:3-deoxy-D-manno-octulosonic-acid transferase